MKLAVRKEPGSIPGSGFHYMLHPFIMQSDVEAAIFDSMGYHIIEVETDKGERLLKQAQAALNHQIEIAVITEQQNG